MSPKRKIKESSANEPLYVISVAARMLGLETYTLRYYERIGILEPSRSAGNIRLYSERDVARLRRIKTLIDDMGVNLAGAEVILHMAERMEQMQHHMEELEQELVKLHEKPDVRKR